MPDILDRVGASRKGGMAPRSEAEFVALQLARSLGDRANAYDYLLLSQRYTIPVLLHAFKALRATHPAGWPALDHFRALVGSGFHAAPMPSPRLLAFRVQRRHAAVAVFEGLKLEFWHVRNLPTRGAEASVKGFAAWALANFPDGDVAVEAPSGSAPSEQARRVRILTALIRERGLPLWEARPADLFRAYGEPAPVRRAEMRKAALAVWPQLPAAVPMRATLDAAALGLFAQVQRLMGAEGSGVPA